MAHHFDIDNLPTRPDWLTDEAMKVLEKGYLMPGETPREMWKRCAVTAEKHLGIESISIDFMEMFWKGYLGGASPVLSNFGTNRGLPISCFSVHLADSVSSIYSHLKEVAALSKNGGGVGVYFGDVRPSGSPISGGGKSTGIVPWMRQYDLAASVVSQGGVRRGSFALYLPIDHPDLVEALRCKDHSQGDPRNFIDSNLAVTITDDWIESMIGGDKEKLKLFGEVLRCRMMSGSPYLVFIDNANNQRPECFEQRNLRISTSNLCFTGDTKVAVADGRNSVPISELVGTQFHVYSARKRKTSGNGFMSQWVTEVKPAIAFKTGTKEIVEVELEDGSTFRCTGDHLLARRDCSWVEAKDSVGEILEPFSSFTNSYGHRMINTVSNGLARQSRMIWESKNGPIPAGYHVDHIVSQGGDNIENLQLLSKEQHLKKTSEERKGSNNPIHKVDPEHFSKAISVATSGQKNPLFSGIDNYELIELGKEVYSELGSFTEKDYLSLRERGYNVPKSFSSYRFGGSFEKYRSYVLGDEVYEGENEILPEAPVNPRELKNQLLEAKVSQIRNNGLRVVSVRPAGVEDVYDLTVEDNHNFYIVTQNDKDDTLSGVLVHNCSEIFLPTDENHTFVCVLSSLNLAKYDEWRHWRGSVTGKTVPELGIYFLDAVVEEFIHKAERITSMGRAVRFAKKSRALGLGTMGKHALFQSRKLPFASKEARALNLEAHAWIDEMTLKASREMALQYGEPEWCEGNGVRHATRLAIAPTKTNSVICGAVSEGIEPLTANLFVAGNAKGTFVRKNPYLEQHLEAVGRNTQDVWDSILEERGSVQHLDFLTPEAKEIFRTAREIDQFEIIKQAADTQKHVCQGISTNLFVDPEASAEYLIRLHLVAWKLGLKSLYYLKSSSLQVKKTKPPEQSVALVVTKEGCPWCDKAKSLLAERGYVVQEMDRSDIPDSEWPYTTVPQVWINGSHIEGGYEGLAAKLLGGETGQYADCAACQG